MSFITFHHLSKRFPGVQALEDVSFTVERGNCHALMGENGAGKSTLGKILAGVYSADSGEIRLDGQVIHPANPLAARRLGLAMVHQELAFCPNLTVAENLCLGDLPRRAGWVQRGCLRDRARAMLREIEAEIDVDQPISRLSTGQAPWSRPPPAFFLLRRVRPALPLPAVRLFSRYDGIQKRKTLS